MRDGRSSWVLLALIVLIAGGWWTRALTSQSDTVSADTLRKNQSVHTPVPVRRQSAAFTLIRLEISPDKVVSDSDSLSTVCRLGTQESEPVWSDWADFTRTRIESKGSVEDVPAYAVRAPNGGVNVMLANHSEGKVEVRLGIKLGRGIFSVARHAFEVESETKHPKTEQLQSVLLKAPGMLSKPVWLMPKSATVVCITDETRSLDRALDEARNALRGVAGSAPRTFRLIRSPLGESAQRIEQIAAQGGAMGRSKLTMRAEQAAMSLSHAQSVFRNARSSGILTGDAADDIGTAFDRLETSISTTAAAGLGLVVSAEWGELPAGDGEAVETPVTVQVSNRGDRSLRSVKLGISAPKGCRISPEEMAVFRAVRPAESVRAEFQVKTDSKKSLKAVRADISYIAGRAPILLRTKIY